MSPGAANVLEKLQESLSAVFDQAQLSIANHRKNCVALYKLHQQAASVTQLSKNGASVKLVGEKVFGDVFIDLVNRVLVVKKGPATADRVVRFVGSYVKFMNEKVSTMTPPIDPSSSISARRSTEDDDDETFFSRFISRLLKWLFRGFMAKNKATRYRSVCVVSELISHLGEIDEETYSVLRENLMERICDKESLIRSHAIIALSKLAGSEDPSEVEPAEKTILEVLLDALCYDPSAEVRRATLLHLPLTQITLSTILSRTRDTDPVIRKLVYSNVLQTRLGHPQQLTISQREQIVKDGLGDREPAVRVAAGKMVTNWFEMVLANSREEVETTWIGDDGGVMKAFLKFLSLFDVVGPGEAVAVDATLSIFTIKPEITDVFIFPDEYWKTLTPESVVLARVFIEDCLATKNEARLEAASLPVVTAFAFHLQESYNVLVDLLQDAENAKFLNAGDDDDEEGEQREEDLAKREIILSELLRMALKLDYMDEIGRRKVFSVVRNMLAHPELPPGLIAPCLDVLKEIMPSERDLIRMVVEVIIELREEDDEPENVDGRSTTNFDDSHSDIHTTLLKEKSLQRAKVREEMTPEECTKADITDLRCLTLCIGMLERVDGTFEDNSTLEGILADLIIPSVKRKELAMREKGLVSLGLCCLIAKNMALSSIQLFLSQVQSAPEELRLRVLQVIFDLLFLYDHEFFGRSDDVAQRIIDFLLQTLEVEDSAPVQALICIGLSKLLLSGIVIDTRALTCLLLTYVSPTTTSNQELRQCLSYFFPVYSYSSPTNQTRMQSIFITTFDLVAQLYEELEEDQEMITPYQFGLLMVDWTNPQKATLIVGGGEVETEIHAELAIDILGALYDTDRSPAVQRVFCQLLNHLNIAPGLDYRSIFKLNILLSHHADSCPFDDTVIDKIFNRFKSRFAALFGKELKRLDPGQFRDKEFREIYEFIGVDMPKEEPGAVAHVLTTNSSREQSEENEDPSLSTDDEPPSSPTPSPRKAGSKHVRNAPKHAVQSTDYDKEEETSDPATPVQPVATPKRKGTKRILTPNSIRTPTSPVMRKRTRVKSPTSMQSLSHPHRESISETAGTTTVHKPKASTRMDLSSYVGGKDSSTDQEPESGSEDSDSIFSS